MAKQSNEAIQRSEPVTVRPNREPEPDADQTVVSDASEKLRQALKEGAKSGSFAAGEDEVTRAGSLDEVTRALDESPFDSATVAGAPVPLLKKRDEPSHPRLDRSAQSPATPQVEPGARPMRALDVVGQREDRSHLVYLAVGFVTVLITLALAARFMP